MYFDSNVLNSYENETTYTRFICKNNYKVFPNETNYFNDNPKPDKREHMRNTWYRCKTIYKNIEKFIYVVIDKLARIFMLR